MDLFPGTPVRGLFHQGFGYYFTGQASNIKFQDVNKQAVYTRLFKMPVTGPPNITPIPMPLQDEDLFNIIAIAADGKIIVSYYSVSDQLTYVKRLMQNGEFDPLFQTVITGVLSLGITQFTIFKCCLMVKF